MVAARDDPTNGRRKWSPQMVAANGRRKNRHKWSPQMVAVNSCGK
jgi:hypothetical protein